MACSAIVHAPDLFEPRSPFRKRDGFFRANAGVDPAILAAELGVTERFVRTRQRKLGLRQCTFSPRKADCLADRP